MKFVYLILLLGLSTAAIAGQAIKTCETKLPNLTDGSEKPVMLPFRVDFNKNGNTVTATSTTTTADGNSYVVKGRASVREFSVRGNLTANTDPDSNLNLAERGVVLALTYKADPDLSFSNLKMDYAKIRSATAYIVEGDQSDMGTVMVLEARDDQGLALGSFLTGFLVGECK